LSRIPDLDYLSEPSDNQEKIAEAWITEGRRLERIRCATLIELDLLLPEGVKQRMLDLIRGGRND
jgi:hypothetical protein